MDNPVKNFLDNLMNNFSNYSSSGSVSSTLGIDISSSSIKLVEIKKKGDKLALETYGSISLGPYANSEIGAVANLPTEKTVEALTEVIKESGASSKFANLSIPIKSSLFFNIYLPNNLNKEETSKIVYTEARKYIPLQLEEVSLSYFEIPKKELSFKEMNDPDFLNENKDKKEMLVVAVQNDTISKFRSITTASKLAVDFFEVEMFSSARACFGNELSLILFIDFGASSFKVSFVEFGVVKNCHTINRGSADITFAISKSLGISFEKAEEYKKSFGLYENPIDNNIKEIIRVHIDYILAELNSILINYQKKYNTTINKIIFTGGGSLLKGFKEELINNFKVEAQLANPFDKLLVPEFLDKILEQAGPEFSVAIGLALRKFE